jgi:hypothetical protein
MANRYDSPVKIRTLRSACAKAGQRPMRTASELSKFAQPSVGVAPHPIFTFTACLSRSAMRIGVKFKY